MNKKSHQFSINKDGFGVMGYDNLSGCAVKLRRSRRRYKARTAKQS